MNKKRKAEIDNVISELRSCSDTLNDIKFDEDTSRENIPDNLKEGEAYEASEECSDILEDAISDLDQVISTLEDIQNR